MIDPNRIFRSQHYMRHTQRRLEHLETLGLDLFNKSVLEPGAGIGDHSMFYLDRGCQVTASEPRPENFAELKRVWAKGAYPASSTFTALDADVWALEGRVDVFDIVHAYGILYHLDDPARALRVMAARCGGMLLLETCVTPGQETAINLLAEKQEDLSQAVGGMGCRPTRPWIMSELKRHFEHVYVTVTQPCHREFPNDWTQPRPPGLLSRAVFVASRHKIDNPTLSTTLSDRQPRRRFASPSGSQSDSTERATLIKRYDIGYVIDVGANSGQYGAGLRLQSGYDGPIVSFEPQTEAYRKLAERCLGDANWRCEQIALGSEAGSAPLFKTANSVSSSLLPTTTLARQIEKGLAAAGSEIVAVNTLTEGVPWDSIKGIPVLLKIDVQGLELDVLKGGETILDRVTLIELEASLFEVYEGEPTLATKLQYLTAHGFRVVAMWPGWRHPGNGELLQVDLMFARGAA